MSKNKTGALYKYKFSFVVPVYNAEAYIAETIESVLAQTMDFEQNCEIVFVNDGSTDNSEEVCLRYKEQFPSNVTYIKQENSGPSVARNNGVAHAQGKYIGLLDSDDKFSPNALEEVYKFFEKHHEEIDLVAMKWEFFEARTGGHPLNYKFTTDRVIDLTTEYMDIQGACTSTFFKEAVLRRHPSDPSVGKYEEDAHLLCEILLENPKYGVVSRPTYFYRKRYSESSSQDSARTDKFWYLKTPSHWQKLFDYARKDGGVPKFLQYSAMYNLQWRFKQQVQAVLTDHEQAEYKALLYGLLSDIDDEIIMAQRELNLDQKFFILSKKHSEPVLSKSRKKGHKYYYHDTEIYDFKLANPAFHIELLEADGAKLHIEGFYGGFLLGDAKLEFRIGDEVYPTEVVNGPKRRLRFLDEFITERSRFKAVIAARPGAVIEAFVTGETAKLPIMVHRFSYLSQSATLAYRTCGPWLIRKRPAGLEVQVYRGWRRTAYELQYMTLLAKRLKLRIFMEQFANWRRLRASGVKMGPSGLKWVLVPAKAAIRNVYAITFRLVYFAVKPFHHRPIWILSDRIMAADDSGEIFFRYLQERRDLNAKVYFTLSKKSSEFATLRQYGKVLDYGSFRYKLLFLLSNKIISSEATEGIINAFDDWADDFVDLYNFDFVFLQHGIIRDDISGWLNRYNKNIKLFVASVKPERESILSGNYGYDESVVKLTGLPRYDKLRNDPKSKLIIMPTWRENLAGKVDFKTGNKQYNPNFKKSDYFAFYQNLMNDERLRRVMQKHDIRGEFYLHPSFQLQIKDFIGNDAFKIMKMPFDYPKAKRDGSLLVTDFSSVAFDFAYLRKPVLYAQFDEDTFYKNHTSNEGYFTYKTDGFGPVTHDYEATVRGIIEIIEGGCHMDKRYQKRVDQFFAHNDRNNSKRVYEAILEMD